MIAKLSPALNEVNPGVHLVRTRWTPGFIRIRPVWSTWAAVLTVPVW